MQDSAAGNSLVARLRKRFDRHLAQLRFRASLRHLHGPRGVFSAQDDVTLIALVRNGSYYLDAFFDHYRGLGIQHFVFFDNGSDDDTIARIRRIPGTAILQSRLPWGQFENSFRTYAARRYAQNRWCLIVDMDEIFDFEGRREIGLPGLIRYLSGHGYTAMMAQMLEMFPKAPLSQVAHMPYPEALRRFSYCDLSGVTALDYTAPETGLSYFLNQNTSEAGTAGSALKVLFGGVRSTVFAENCCLTKHPLVFVGPGVEAGVHPHAATGVNLAPMTALLKHYKFANDSLNRDRRSVATAAISHGEDHKRLSVLSRNPDLSLWSETARELSQELSSDITMLQDRQFLVRSEAYTDFVRQSGPNPAPVETRSHD